jgi:hypothetical protein
MKKLLILGIVLAAAYFGAVETGLMPTPRGDSAAAAATADRVLASAFENQRGDFQVQGGGEVSKTLPDDDDGSRHQRFVVRLSSGQTLLVAHNIDLAPRIPSLKVGNYVEFNGEYEWNAKGGVIHWTHHDPQGRHETGWIKHGGQVYR